MPGVGWVGGWVGWLDTDNRAISVQLNLTGTATGTELGKKDKNIKKSKTLFAIGLTLFQIIKYSKKSKFDFFDCLINLGASGNSGFLITHTQSHRHTDACELCN